VHYEVNITIKCDGRQTVDGIRKETREEKEKSEGRMREELE
jgi:hypothetical protein